MDIRNKNVIDSMYYSDLWIKLCKESKNILLTGEEIEEINNESIGKGYISNIFLEDEELTREFIEKCIRQVSKKVEGDLYIKNLKVTKEDFDVLEENMNIKGLMNRKGQYGIVVKRGKLRTFPTDERVFKVPDTYELDRFMESAVYVGEPILIYWISNDGNWFFGKTYNCSGWIHRDYVAIGTKEEVETFTNCRDFIVVTGRKIMLGYNPMTEVLSEKNLDMGIKLPIEKYWERDNTVFDMYTEGNYIVKYPLRDERGNLKLTHVLIPFSEDVHEGYLRCNRANILRQGFKFQGERYGWGGEFEGRDCSSMIVDIFRTFGIYFPRNTGEQLRKSTGKVIYFHENLRRSDRMKVINNLRPGDLVYLSGHVAMIVGKYKDRVYVIHDVIGVHVEEEGELVYLPIRGVTVSSLSDIYTSSKINYVDALIGVKEIFKL